MRVLLAGLRTASEANQREHWRKRYNRQSVQKQSVQLEVGVRSAEFPELPVIVTMTRIAPRKLDDDNLVGSFKAVRDALATLLLPELTQGNQYAPRGDDSDNRLTFRCDQRKGEPKQYAVEISIESAI